MGVPWSGLLCELRTAPQRVGSHKATDISIIFMSDQLLWGVLCCASRFICVWNDDNYIDLIPRKSLLLLWSLESATIFSSTNTCPLREPSLGFLSGKLWLSIETTAWYRFQPTGLRTMCLKRSRGCPVAGLTRLSSSLMHSVRGITTKELLLFCCQRNLVEVSTSTQIHSSLTKASESKAVASETFPGQISNSSKFVVSCKNPQEMVVCATNQRESPLASRTSGQSLRWAPTGTSSRFYTFKFMLVWTSLPFGPSSQLRAQQESFRVGLGYEFIIQRKTSWILEAQSET